MVPKGACIVCLFIHWMLVSLAQVSTDLQSNQSTVENTIDNNQTIPKSHDHRDIRFKVPILNGNVLDNITADNGTFVVQIRKMFWLKNVFICGGSLVGPRTVLTAAHCVHSRLARLMLRVRYGTHKLSGHHYKEEHLVRIIVHPKYNRTTYENDIAIVILKRPVKFNSKVSRILLESKEVLVNSTLWLYGWEWSAAWSRGLTATALSKHSNSQCKEEQEMLGLIPSDKVICASSQSASFCNGYSGGPLITEDRLLAGIVSVGIRGCPTGNVTLFSKVSKYLKFIKKYSI